MTTPTPAGVSRRRWQAEIVRLHTVLDRLLAEGPAEPRVLEAGCGSATHVSLPASARLVGLDVSPEQLERNDLVQEKILGDVQTYPLPANGFDVVICWELLEHVPEPLRALDNLIGTLRPGGLLILAFPNVLSVKGLVTKLSPHWFHVWFYRQVLGDRLAGGVGRPPFPTCLPLAMAPERICDHARRRGLTLAYVALYEAGKQVRLRQKLWISGWRWRLARGLVQAGSLGRVRLDGTDCILVLRRPAQRPIDAPAAGPASAPATAG
jgi:SAM-dependent methyltransferase